MSKQGSVGRVVRTVEGNERDVKNGHNEIIKETGTFFCILFTTGPNGRTPRPSGGRESRRDPKSKGDESDVCSYPDTSLVLPQVQRLVWSAVCVSCD